MSKFLITSGKTEVYEFVTKSEIVELSVAGNYHKCPYWADYPLNLERATGGLLGENPIICGGRSDNNGEISNDCFIVYPTSGNIGPKMLYKRYAAASVVMSD